MNQAIQDRLDKALQEGRISQSYHDAQEMAHWRTVPVFVWRKAVYEPLTNQVIDGWAKFYVGFGWTKEFHRLTVRLGWGWAP